MSEINTLWKVDNVTHVIEDGGVIEVLYSATTSSGEASVYNGGRVTLEYDASDSSFVPLSDLTEEIVMGWVKDSLGEEVVSLIETTGTEKVNKQLNPTTQSGLPWVEEVVEEVSE